MSTRNTFIRSMHDLGLAAWFGGGLMGAVGLNGAAAEAKDPAERTRFSLVGWGRWTPVQLAAMAVHGIGGIGLILSNKTRLVGQSEARTNTTVKLVVTGAAIAASVYAGVLGKGIADHEGEHVEGTTEPSSKTSDELASVQRQQRIVQWTIPALTGVLIVLAAQQGEQQQSFAGVLGRALRKR